MANNVEIVRAIYRAFDERDWDAIRGLLAPEVEWHQFTALPDQATFRGPDEVVDRFLRAQWLDQFPDIVVEIHELIDAGDNVAAIGRAHGRGRGSGIAIDLRFAHFWRLRDGRRRGARRRW